jgi:TPR repeat protein
VSWPRPRRRPQPVLRLPQANPAEAAKWYRYSADQGYNDAKVWLAHLYSQGRGVEKNLSKARALYHEAEQPFHKTLVKSDVPLANQLAWFLVTDENESVRDPESAVELAQKAIALEPKDGSIWNTLGVAQYRAGNLPAAIKALKLSLEFRKGGDAFDYFFLAMAEQKSAHPDEAHKWYDKSLESMETKEPKNRMLIRFRAEAAETLGLPLPLESNSDHASAGANTAADSEK